MSSQIDKGVIERLSMQTLVGGKKAGTVQPAAAESAAATKGKAKEVQEATPVKPAKGKGKATPTPSKFPAADTPTAASPSKPSNAARKSAAVSAAEAAGRSVREQLRQEKKEKNLRRRERKREKNERIKKRKLENGEPLPCVFSHGCLLLRSTWGGFAKWRRAGLTRLCSLFLPAILRLRLPHPRSTSFLRQPTDPCTQ